ncbi:hypothetical protein BJX63DRAFT_438136 [Aspergillus granulosus]|uniref:ABM domain-containing protein n=1 Tax=Aspergillus granulosus TaxID=176169 RepID=A0ABR4GUK8_9EURO
MRFISTLTALTLAGSTLSQRLPRPGWNSPDPVTAVLTLTPKKGMTQQESAFQLEDYIRHGQNITTTESEANTKFLWFKVTGKDLFVVIEQYTNQEDMFEWVVGPQHMQLTEEFLPLADIFKSGVQSDMKLL